MDAINRWFEEQSSTPVGSILLFMLVLLSRLALDQWTRRRLERKHREKPRKPAGA